MLLHNVGLLPMPPSKLCPLQTVLFSTPAANTPLASPLLLPLPTMLRYTAVLLLPTNKPSSFADGPGILLLVRAAAACGGAALLLTKFAPAGTLRPRCRQEDDRLAPRLPAAVLRIVSLASRCTDDGAVISPPPTADSDLFASSAAGAGRLNIRQSVSFTVNSRT